MILNIKEILLEGKLLGIIMKKYLQCNTSFKKGIKMNIIPNIL